MPPHHQRAEATGIAGNNAQAGFCARGTVTRQRPGCTAVPLELQPSRGQQHAVTFVAVMEWA